MTDQLLREALTRMAARVEPSDPDPTLWSRGRRARRRSDTLTAAAVGLAVFALVAIGGFLGSPDPSRPEPAPAGPGRPGLPSEVDGVAGGGGFDLESDLAVGRASVAIANPAGAFVVTAADGEYHRLALPGFDASVYDDAEVRRTGMVGLQLSPDGRRLAYGWHAALPDGTGRARGLVDSGVRLLDLVTGEVETVADLGPAPFEFGAARRNRGFPFAVVPYGIRWSANSRFVTYDLVWVAVDPEGPEGPRRIGDAFESALSNSAASVYDTQTRERFGVNEFSRGLGWTGWPQMVSRNGLVGTAGGSGMVFAERDTRRRVLTLPVSTSWSSGLFAAHRGALVETENPSRHLLSVDLRTGDHRLLTLEIEACRVDLLGWLDRDHVLAQVNRATGPDSWAEDADLVVLDLSDERVESNLAAPVYAQGTASTFSYAIDYATVRHPTGDFTDRPAAGSPPRDAPAAEPRDSTSGPDRRWLVGGLGAGALAGVVVLLALRRRARAR